MRSKFTMYLRRASGAMLCLFVFLACEEPVELSVELPKSRLVINSNFYPAEVVTLRVAATRPSGTPRVNITDAQVSLFEGSKLAEELKYYPDGDDGLYGSYRTRVFRPVVGKEYTIHVAATGYDPVTAVSSIPKPVAIDSLLLYDVSMDFRDGLTLYDYRLSIEYADPQNATNYYDLRIYQRVLPYHLNEKGDTIIGKPYLKSVGTPTHRSDDETVSVLLQDQGGVDHVEVQLQSAVDGSRELLAEIVAELRTVSPEYYFYKRSLAAGAGAPPGGLSEPVILFNNVEQGLGIFAGYNAVKAYLPLVRN